MSSRMINREGGTVNDVRRGGGAERGAKERNVNRCSFPFIESLFFNITQIYL